MKFRPGSLLTIVVALVFLYALFEARLFPVREFIYPIVSASAGLVFAALALWQEVRAKSVGVEQDGLLDVAANRSIPTKVVYKRAARVLAWFLGIYVGMWLFGAKITFAVFFIAFLKLEGRASWRLALLLTALGVYLMAFQLEHLLNMAWPQGWIEKVFELPGFL